MQPQLCAANGQHQTSAAPGDVLVNTHRLSRFSLNRASHSFLPDPILLLTLWGFLSVYPHHTCFPALPHTLVTYTQQEKKKRVYFVLSTYSCSVVKLPVACPQHELRPSPTHHPCWMSSAVKGDTQHPSTLFKNSFSTSEPQEHGL